MTNKINKIDNSTLERHTTIELNLADVRLKLAEVIDVTNKLIDIVANQDKQTTSVLKINTGLVGRCKRAEGRLLQATDTHKGN